MPNGFRFRGKRVGVYDSLLSAALTVGAGPLMAPARSNPLARRTEYRGNFPDTEVFKHSDGTLPNTQDSIAPGELYAFAGKG